MSTPAWLAAVAASPSFVVTRARSAIRQSCCACSSIAVARITLPGKPPPSFAPSLGRLRYACRRHAVDVARGAHTENPLAGTDPVKIEWREPR